MIAAPPVAVVVVDAVIEVGVAAFDDALAVFVKVVVEAADLLVDVLGEFLQNLGGLNRSYR